MLLNARNNQFDFKFPRNFIPEAIEEKYGSYLNRIPGNVVEKTIDFINYTIQSVSIPSFGFDPAEVQTNDGTVTYFKGSQPLQQLIDREFTVTFQLVDGYINYWILLDTLLYYYVLDNNIDDFLLRMKDSEGNALVTIKMIEPIMKMLTELELSFASNVAEFQTFDVSFTYNIMEINMEID